LVASSEIDLDLLGVLANQSAVAIENADWSATLENRVTERTAELKQSNDHLEQLHRRARPSSTRPGRAGQAARLSAIIDLVGDEIMRVLPPPERKRAYIRCLSPYMTPRLR
jgi:nitrate/nitrite-specific signal transduction histidine kinase